jgi:hypothetical protein
MPIFPPTEISIFVHFFLSFEYSHSICSSQRCFGKHPPSDREDRLCETLEQRYLALWLASLESLELISHFKARYAKVGISFILSNFLLKK